MVAYAWSAEHIEFQRDHQLVVTIHLQYIMAIDLIVDRWSMAFNEFREHKRALQHIDVIV